MNMTWEEMVLIVESAPTMCASIAGAMGMKPAELRAAIHEGRISKVDVWKAAGSVFDNLRTDALHAENLSEQLVMAEAEVDRLREELAVTEKLLESREQILQAILECPVHGACVPHALEWIQSMRAGAEPQAADAEPLVGWDDGVTIGGERVRGIEEGARLAEYWPSAEQAKKGLQEFSRALRDVGAVEAELFINGKSAGRVMNFRAPDVLGVLEQAATVMWAERGFEIDAASFQRAREFLEAPCGGLTAAAAAAMEQARKPTGFAKVDHSPEPKACGGCNGQGQVGGLLPGGGGYDGETCPFCHGTGKEIVVGTEDDGEVEP